MSTLVGLRPTRCGHRTSTSEWTQRPLQDRRDARVYACGGLGAGFRAGSAFPAVKAFRRQIIIRTSYDDEFRDSKSIALGLHKRYKDVQNGGFNNLKEFIHAGVTAYEVGCTDEGMRKELLSIDLNELSDEKSEGGGSVGLKSRLGTEE